MTTVVQGFIEAIDQALEILRSIKSEDYREAAKPILDYSIGSHFRHNLDVFNSIKAGFDTGLVDYDIRRRGHSVEINIDEAVNEHQLLKEWVQSVADKDVNKIVKIKSEALLSKTKSIEIEGSLAREMLFASSHAVHHYAIISTALKYRGSVVDKNIGYAPATASYLRDSKK